MNGNVPSKFLAMSKSQCTECYLKGTAIELVFIIVIFIDRKLTYIIYFNLCLHVLRVRARRRVRIKWRRCKEKRDTLVKCSYHTQKIKQQQKRVEENFWR